MCDGRDEIALIETPEVRSIPLINPRNIQKAVAVLGWDWLPLLGARVSVINITATDLVLTTFTQSVSHDRLMFHTQRVYSRSDPSTDKRGKGRYS